MKIYKVSVGRNSKWGHQCGSTFYVDEEPTFKLVKKLTKDIWPEDFKGSKINWHFTTINVIEVEKWQKKRKN